MLKPLNWKECAALVGAIGPEIQGLFVDRVVIPERADFPEGHLRHEWVIRLTGRRAEAALFFSLRPRQPYLALCQAKGPKAAGGATHSPFSLSLSKHLKGAKVLGIEALPRERIVVLWFSSEGVSSDRERLGLVLSLIPAVPEAHLVRAPGASATAGGEWSILSRSRTVNEATAPRAFTPPSGAKAPEAPEVRSELFAGSESYFKEIERAIKREAFDLRALAASRGLRDLIKQARERIRQSGTALKEAEREADWQRYGELLKASLHDAGEIAADGTREVTDYGAEGEATRLRIPCDPQLDPSQQTSKFFTMARRKARRADEARLRIETFSANLAKWEAALAEIPGLGSRTTLSPEDWRALETMERLAQTRPAHRAQEDRAGKGGGKGGKVSSWLGKTFTSKDGLTILAGRSKDENLELTFKHARGNDVWLHVRGRPGAHVLVPLGNGKSAPLETLLDAATLAIYYSGGEKWGKTEVDYALKKYVRRIKDSTEASYTNNKTLLVEPDAARIKRLLDGQG